MAICLTNADIGFLHCEEVSLSSKLSLNPTQLTPPPLYVDERLRLSTGRVQTDFIWSAPFRAQRCRKFRRGSFILNLPLGPSVNHVGGTAVYGVYALPPGRRTVKTEPLPGSLVTVTSPPIRRASLRVMARPSPVPPKRCAVVASAWVNSSNNLACCS